MRLIRRRQTLKQMIDNEILVEEKPGEEHMQTLERTLQ
jgi:hypothetical protein